MVNLKKLVLAVESQMVLIRGWEGRGDEWRLGKVMLQLDKEQISDILQHSEIPKIAIAHCMSQQLEEKITNE